MLVTRQITGNIKEIFLPMGQTRIKQVLLTLRTDGLPTLKKDESPVPGLNEEETETLDPDSSARKISDVKITRVEQEEIMPVVCPLLKTTMVEDIFCLSVEDKFC